MQIHSLEINQQAEVLIDIRLDETNDIFALYGYAQIIGLFRWG